ncbi:MAG TPA: MerR family transcriptional regulator, partial [Ferruginibacter sp.]|nr:MerR family transcriptional regulator [Ferruginibacter sp.]
MPLHQISFDFDTAPVQEEKPVAKPKQVVVAKPQPEKVKARPADNKKTTRGRMRLKEMDAGADLIEIPEDEILFQKSYYTIGTVAEMFKVNQSLIRLWENEF